MRNFSLFFFSISFFFLISLQPGFTQTIVPGGYVSGTWTAAGSPYLVQGDITIHTDSTLNIQPGVEVNFQGNYSFTVNGLLQAIGTGVDSIHFTAVTNWQGLRFTNAPDSSHLVYCTISGSTTFGGILCTNSNPVITYSTISNNGGTVWGGIYLSNSNANISYCTISNNLSLGDGGGIYMASSSPQISYCTITGNYGNVGGGIYIAASNPSIDNCTISDNHSGSGGGIAFLSGGQATITDCIITADTANGLGGGIYVSSPGGTIIINNSNISHCKAPSGGGIYIAQADNVFMSGCTFKYNAVNNAGGGGAVYINQAGTVSMMKTIFDNNYCGSYPGGVVYSVNCSNLVIDHCDLVNNNGQVAEGGIKLNGNTSMIVKNCIFRNQDGPQIWFENYTSASVSYNDFFESYSIPFVGGPSGLGVLTTVNTNGDSCDVYSNILLDPLFVDFANSDYHLSWANWPTPDSTKSPCIDSGDPLSPLDPDGTIADMGVFSFDQSIPVELVSFTAELSRDIAFLKWITATETNNSGFEIERRQDNSGWEKIGFVEGHGTTTEPNSYSFEDKNISTGIYLYRLKQIDYNGSFEYSIEVKLEVSVPSEFSLEQNYPNPFNPETKIKYSVPQASQIQIKVYDILGNKIETLVNEEKSVGTYEITWNAENLPSGVYFYQLKAGEFVQTKKMLLMK